jgi:hypothetical protein
MNRKDDAPMKSKYRVIDKFNLTNRGTAIVIEKVTNHVPGKPYQITIMQPDGSALTAIGYKEWLLKREGHVIEKEAYTLKDLCKEDIQDGSEICFNDD